MRRSVRRNQAPVALFPFLAVLICTMGSLIVLLVLMVHQARVHARTLAAHQAAATEDDEQKVRHRVEEAQWKRELLEQSRAEKSSEFADARARLAHLEDHIQKLQQDARALLERARQIDEGQQPRGDELAAARAELARLQAEIERKQGELEAQRERLKKQERWYALIPYEGPHGTRRRPIYIECTELGVVIQPEGLVLMANDFNGPLTAGNPLDAALRTIREHLQRTSGGEQGEPYPLLVVRPSGVLAHNVARAALKAWDDEFGYELVSEDKKLAFGVPDPVLAAQLEKTVALARQRQAAMVAMMPRRYQNDDPLTSFAVEDAPGLNAARATTGGRGFGSGAGRTGAGAGSGNGGVGGDGAAGRYPMNAAQPHSQTNPFMQPGSQANGQPGGPDNPSTGSHEPGGASGGQPAFATPDSRSPAPGSADSRSGANAGQAGQPGQVGSPDAAGRPGGSAFGSTSGNMAGPSLSAPGNPATGTHATSQSGTPDGSSTQQGGSTAAKRGRGQNWGLQGATPRATAVTRPIHLAVLADRVVIVPERGVDRSPQHLPLSPQIAPQEIDRFVSAVQREMKSWGLAVANGYWKPVLHVEVAPDAEHHFADLVRALDGSGFEIERKQP
jgi:hypothetical protein